jgi:DNA-directed RNA polymerase specialized sigma24 family protein
MGIDDTEKPADPPKIPLFQAENHKPQLSISIDDAEIGFFYLEYYRMVYERCLFILGNKEDAQDAAHDIFEKIQELKTQGRLNVLYPKTYLSTTASNMSINKRKKARRELYEINNMATNESLNRFRGREEQGQEK